MSNNKFKENMKSKFLIGLLIAFMGMVSLSSCERIDAGHEGIKVSLYGDDKGVGEAALVTGRVWYNPFTSEALHKENFQLEQLTSGLKYPQTIVDAVNAKNKAEKEANQLREQALTSSNS